MRLLSRFAPFICFISSAVSAQIVPINQSTSSAHVVFTGTVTNDVTKSIQIRQPDGTFAAYTGPVPAYPYKVGDTVSISMDIVVPSANAISSGSAAQYLGTDGLYHFPITGTTGNIGAISNVKITGPGTALTQVPNQLGSSAVKGIIVDFNPATASYGLDSTNGGHWTAIASLPTYTYSSSAGTFGTTTGSGISATTTTANADCAQGTCSQPVISGTDTTATVGSPNVSIFDSITGLVVGFFSGFNLSGSFNLPTQAGSTGATDVPEPSAVALYLGGFVALVALRRRKKPKAA